MLLGLKKRALQWNELVQVNVQRRVRDADFDNLRKARAQCDSVESGT
jgi:hypothetical protein